MARGGCQGAGNIWTALGRWEAFGAYGTASHNNPARQGSLSPVNRLGRTVKLRGAGSGLQPSFRLAVKGASPSPRGGSREPGGQGSKLLPGGRS